MQAECDFESELVISGIAGRFPKSNNLDEFWQNLIDGTDMVSDEFDRFDTEELDIPSRLAVIKDLAKFDADFFPMHGKQAAFLDAQIRKLLEVTYEAIVDAGIHPDTLRGSRTGVFVGACDDETQAIMKRSFAKINPYMVLGSATSMLANRLSYNFDLHGPSCVLDTACSSSAAAIQQALLSIRAGLCDAAIVASSRFYNDPVGAYCFHTLKMTSPDGKCKVLDAAADGYVKAEAVVAIYICKKQVANRMYATLVHASTNNDGFKEQGVSFPSELSQEKVTREVYRVSGVSPLEVDYVEIHGTGTKAGDPEEMAAVAKVFCEGRAGPLLVGSVKSNMGHSEPVAGLCSIAKVILSHAHGVIPANLHFNNPNPAIPSLIDGRVKVVAETQSFNAKYVGINSMGFGGSNVHILLKLHPRGEKQGIWNPPVPIVLLSSGRTQEAVEGFLEKALSHRQNHDFVSLTHKLVKHDTLKHGFRGYVVIGQDKMEIQVDKRDFGREMWYIFTGLGSQWAGMSRDLIRFDAFKQSVRKSADTLLNNHNFDIMSLLECGDSKKFEDFKNSVVSITTIQVALVDLLKTIGIEPKGIVGHSTGEVAAGYADGCLTQHQAVLTSFARVRAVLESNLRPGMVASVGLKWEDAKKRCPPGVYPAIHNAKENVTIAGSPEDITAFIKILESEGVFTKLVRSASFGFHSPLVEESGKLAKVLLEEIIPEPKPRSKKWLSSSVPVDRWDTDLAKYCSADYYVNNGVNPVYFYPTLLHMPENCITLEIAPHCFMQTILKQSLPKNAVTTGLIHVKSPDNCLYFLDAIGKCYLAGVNVNISALYKPVAFPVPATTPNISSMIQWDHSDNFPVPHHKQEMSRQKGVQFTFNLSTEHDAFLEGHSVDGKILFPATGYMWMVWKCFAKDQESRFDKHPVVFENVRFERITLLNKQRDTEFLVNILSATGKFEILELGMLVCSGTVRNVNECAENEMLKYDVSEQEDASGSCICKEDFYKELHLRGYGHSGLFQGIEQADMNGKWAKVKWQGEWISFIDTIFQAFLLRNQNRDLYVPIRVQKLTIDPIQVKNYLDTHKDIVEVKSWEMHRSGTCPGLEFRGLNLAKFNQKAREVAPTIIEQTFLPYLRRSSRILSESNALEASLEIAVDNSSGLKFLFAEILKTPKNMISHLMIKVSMLKFPAFESRLVNESGEPIGEDLLASGLTKTTTLKDLQAQELNHVVYVDDESNISSAADLIIPGGLILFKGHSTSLNQIPGLSIVSEKSYLTTEGSEMGFYLFRKLSKIHSKPVVITMDVEEFTWVEVAKETLKSSAELYRVYFVSSCPRSGISGFFRCLVREYSSEKLRCFHAIDETNLDVSNPTGNLRAQVEKDLVFNVFKDGCWGTLSNLSITREEFQMHRMTPFAYANALTLGELSSLSWIESPLRAEEKELVQVHFASLNFRDIMLASGKLAQDALTKKASKSECVLGLEFSGQYNGRRVCGMGVSECLATCIDPKQLVLLDIPDNWTYEEAATVPCVYVTVYLALIIRGKMQPGESVLIHAGSGGVGQAAIQVALSMGCRVFTTVSTTEKREFLKARFPALTDECFANSRDAREFESHIYTQTRGRGVDLVLNSLAQDKLFASIRCLAINGRFLEIGKFDLFNDTKIGMSILSKGVSIVGILLALIFEEGTQKELTEMRNYLNDGMKSGGIRPLTYQVFKHSQLEEAFRFMAKGKHIGKVLIQIKDNVSSSASVPAYPKTYFNPKKSYIIVGGLGGMGFELVYWMVTRGARRFVLSSRSGNLSTYQEYHISLWKQKGITVETDRSDVSTFEGAQLLLVHAQKLGEIGGIFNVAVVLKDALFDNQTQADFKDIIKCKANATIHLDSLSRHMAPELDYFVVFSSIIAARGNPGQTNYGFANSVMERICEQRKAEGLPALAVQWGAVGDVGVFHRTMKDKNVFDLAPQSIKSCLETLDLYLRQDRPVVSSFVSFQRKEVGTVDTTDTLVNIVANILGIKNIKKVNFKAPLVDLGLDSLMAGELAKVLQSRANMQLPQKAYTQLTLERLAEIDSNGGLPSDGCQDDATELKKVLRLRPLPNKPIIKMKSLKTSNDTVFIVHPMDGTVSMLEELVSQLDATVYGIEYVKEAPLESIEKLAAYYLRKVREIQPSGPYKIAGYSFGGTVAFEMALQLETQRQVVSLLMLLDASPRLKHITESWTEGAAAKQEWEDAIFLGYLTQYKSDVSSSQMKELLEIKSTDARIAYVANVLHEANPEISLAELMESAEGCLVRVQCALRYEASGKVKARTVLVKALRSKVDKNEPSDFGLSEVCENGVEVVEVDGNHYCFYEKPVELGLPAIMNKILV